MLKNIFDYIEGKMSENEKSDFLSRVNASDENKRKFYDVLNFKTERNMIKARIPKKELEERKEEIYAKIKWGGVKYNSKRFSIRGLAVSCVAVVTVIGLAFFTNYYIQHIKQEETIAYLATVEIQDEKNDVDLLLSTGERIVVSEEKTELDKSDIKIVADGNSVSISNIKNINKVEPEKEKLNYLTVKSKEDFMLSLEDGSKIWLRHDSKVGFPNKFSAGCRIIEFEGEGYFDITSDSLRPFIIKTKDIEVKVFGTEFNLKSEKSRSVVEVSMISGRLAVKNRGDEDIFLTPNRQLVLYTESDSYKILEVDNFKYKAWKDGYFYFENDNLKDIIEVLSYMYEIEIVIKSDKYNGELFNGKMKRSNGLDKIISALEESYKFKFYMEEGILYIY